MLKGNEFRFHVARHYTTKTGITVLYSIFYFSIANFKKVSQLASSSAIITPSVDTTNGYVSHLMDTHPVLVLQWCQVLRQLKYMDAHFWCEFIDTGTRLSTGRNYTRAVYKVRVPCSQPFIPLYFEISSTGSKVRTTLYSAINSATGKYCWVVFI